MANGDPEETTHAGTLLSLSIPSVLVFGTLGYGKFHCANVVRSPAMRKDAVCSAAGAVLSFAVCLGTTAWWIDPTVAIVVSVSLFVFGLRTLHKNWVEGNKWWTPEWWGHGTQPKQRLDEGTLATTELTTQTRDERYIA